MLIGSRHLQVGWSLAAMLAALTSFGCGGGSSGASATFSWDIYDIEDTAYQTRLDCASVGASQVVLSLTSQNTGHVYTPVATASCSAGQVTTSPVPVGDYAVGFDLYGDPNVYGNASTVLDTFDTTSVAHLGPGFSDFGATPEPFFVRSFFADWQLYNSQNLLTTCLSGERVDIEFLTPGAPAWVTTPFYCPITSGATFAIPYSASSAQWNMYFVDSTGQQDLATINGTTVATPANSDVDLGSQTFYLSN